MRRRRDPRLRARLERGAATRCRPGYRAVLVLHDVEGLQHEEIADILGCRVGTSKSQLHKARARKMRELLGGAPMKCSKRKAVGALDGDLSARQTRKVRAHVDGCASCARALADLETMQARARRAVRAAAADGRSGAAWVQPAAQAGDRARAARLRAGVRLASGPPSLAALLLAAGGGAWLRWHKGRGRYRRTQVIAQAETEFHSADEHYRRAVDELRTVASDGRRGWPLPKRRPKYDAAQARWRRP